MYSTPQRAAADVMVNAMNSVHGQGYIHGDPGPHSGSTMDWGKGSAGIKYSHLLELRDDGSICSDLFIYCFTSHSTARVIL